MVISKRITTTVLTNPSETDWHIVSGEKHGFGPTDKRAFWDIFQLSGKGDVTILSNEDEKITVKWKKGDKDLTITVERVEYTY
jgi:hypothetical protein